MSPSFPSADPARHALRTATTAFAIVCLISFGCTVEREGGIGEPIEMGPWRFEVERAFDIIESDGSGGPYKFVTVELKLHNYQERHEKPFDDFLNGYRRGAFIAFPKINLMDKDGTSFDGWAIPDSGGSLRSERWTVRFRLVPSSMVSIMQSDSDLAPKYLDTELSDLRMVITNPDRRTGQPGTLSVRLK